MFLKMAINITFGNGPYVFKSAFYVMSSLEPQSNCQMKSSDSSNSIEMVENNFSIINLCIEREIDKLRLVLENGKDPDEIDRKGRSALHFAASRGWDDIMLLLIENGADVTLSDCQGNTPLHYCGHVETIQCLLNYGADPTLKNKVGDNPLDLMLRRGVEENAIALLEDYHDDSETHDLDESAHLLLERIRRRTNEPTGKLVAQRSFSTPKRQSVKNIWTEFYNDVGLEKLLILILVLLCLSLYVAYAVSTLAKKIDSKIPIEEEGMKMEL